MSPVNFRRWRASLCLLFLIAACGNQQGVSTDTGVDSVPGMATTTSAAVTMATTGRTETTQASSEGEEFSPCAITDPETVGTYFEGTAGEGLEGFARNCTYFITGGLGGVQKVDVFHLGPAAAWDGIRAQYEETRMGIIEVEGIGVGAFHPVDHGVRDIVFQTGGQVYSIVVFGGATPEQLAKVESAVLSLAATIVDQRD